MRWRDSQAEARPLRRAPATAHSVSSKSQASVCSGGLASRADQGTMDCEARSPRVSKDTALRPTASASGHSAQALMAFSGVHTGLSTDNSCTRTPSACASSCRTCASMRIAAPVTEACP